MIFTQTENFFIKTAGHKNFVRTIGKLLGDKKFSIFHLVLDRSLYMTIKDRSKLGRQKFFHGAIKNN